ncbi:unnamed protein product [Tilletia controversa]|uniref:Indoleamine 2,3-dioxygenase n=3 Tax=Tilletia TaxID=13289 RepID=A0A8X7MRW7_9BASI|nr:hypothetical protein CF328_g4626 [Tilletia controversa]KAE8195195.1 hypothetical protein CF336_g3202 [Tilletia laevis]KAE8262469.1 hypothetical protein A4X03_0g2434 [Tilletia caries]KAE8245945.1 hypothetical protein A4X06_0g5304 [Tilletia controversa]CAD6887280.1 unnamed protein product [Tilletia caries]
MFLKKVNQLAVSRILRPSFAGGTRHLASATTAIPIVNGHQAQEPYLLEDLAPVKSGDKAAINTLPAFVISRQRGFLPRFEPMAQLPDRFSKLESLLQRMTIHQPDGSSGLLATGDLGPAVLDELSVSEHDSAFAIQAAKDPDADARLLNALFRDYCFLTSAYLLEPTDQAFRATGKYGPGRGVLPAQLAVPLCALADRLGHAPYMEYASSYALSNFRLKSETFKSDAGKWHYDNMELIRAFEDAQGSEAGFILVHVHMLAHSGAVVSGVEDTMRAVEQKNVPALEHALEKLLLAYRRINETMETMWAKSKPNDYLKFRTFIFGSGPKKMNAMFPEGVVYEGVSEGAMAFPGESGANDSLIPSLDNLLEITAHFPNNELTAMLRNFRSYRPRNQREFLTMVEHRAKDIGVRSYAMDGSKSARAKALYILLLDQNREFRDRHWRFTKAYITSKSDYTLATGGSPILRYLPHNLSLVLSFLEQSYEDFTALDRAELANEGATAGKSIPSAELLEAVQLAGSRAAAQRRILTREVADLTRAKADEAAQAGMGDVEEFRRGMLPADHPTAAFDKLAAERATKRGLVGCDGVG